MTTDVRDRVPARAARGPAPAFDAPELEALVFEKRAVEGRALALDEDARRRIAARVRAMRRARRDARVRAARVRRALLG